MKKSVMWAVDLAHTPYNGEIEFIASKESRIFLLPTSSAQVTQESEQRDAAGDDQSDSGHGHQPADNLSLIHISEPTRPY